MNDKQVIQQQLDQITLMQDVLIDLKQTYAAAVREAWIDGFENGCDKPEEAKEYSGKHFSNSKFRMNAVVAEGKLSETDN